MSPRAGMRPQATIVSTSTKAVVWTVLGFCALAYSLTVVLDSADDNPTSSLLFLPFCVAFTVVGTTILLRGGSPTMGGLFLSEGVVVVISLLLSTYASYAATDGRPAAAWAGVGFALSIWLSFVPVALILQLFPDGRALTPRWRPLVWVTVGVAALGMIASGLSAQEDFTKNFPALRHPLLILPPGLGAVTYATAQLTVVALIFVSAGVVGLRYRRARGVERQQVTWLMASGAVAAIGLVAAVLLTPEGDGSVYAFAILMPLVPVACGFAILRYRLYEIDRIISRTLAYALVTGTLLALYFVVVTTVTQLLPGTSGSFSVAAATLAAAALFRPLLTRVQGVVDRSFNRGQYDAQQTVDTFAVRLRDEVDPDEVSADLVAVLDRTLQPARVALWVRHAS